jgi:hypothetical protein
MERGPLQRPVEEVDSIDLAVGRGTLAGRKVADCLGEEAVKWHMVAAVGLEKLAADSVVVGGGGIEEEVKIVVDCAVAGTGEGLADGRFEGETGRCLVLVLALEFGSL